MTRPETTRAGHARPRRWLHVCVLAAIVVSVAWVVWVSSYGDGSARSIDHRAPVFHESVGFSALVLTVGYLVGLFVWAWRQNSWTMLVRHVTSAAAMLVLVVLYLAARGGFGYNGHSWNQSFGDASVILYAVTLAIGPLARLWRPAGLALAWRRETSIWATIAAAFHVAIFWEWSLGWDWRPFFFPEAPGDAVAAATAFHVANAIGVVALAYALVLAVTSNDASQRWLKTGGTWLQKRATTMWLLVLLHTWVFAAYVTFGTTIAITLWLSFSIVLLLQTAAFVKTVRRRKHATAEGRTDPTLGP